MNTKKLIGALTLSAMIFSSCAEKSGNNSKKPKLIKDLNGVDSKTESVVKNLQTQLVHMNQAQSLTLVLLPKKDLQVSIEKMLKAGGKLVYDPNNRLGNSIPFYIAELTPDLINDTDFMKSLELKAASIDHPSRAARPIETKLESTNINFTNYIPTDSVKLQDLGDTTSLGEGVTVAVIDTGIDASHPAFGNRVVYWYDATQETRTELKQMSVASNSIHIDVDGKIQKVILPKEITENKEVYATVMQEKKFIAQLDAQTRNSVGYLDLNSNKLADNFLVVVTKNEEEGTKIYFDVTGDLKLASLSEAKSKIDYNETTKENRDLGMISFPTRNNILKYPVLLEEENKKLYINLGKVDGMHGTHVAGIIAADDQKNNLLGAAPKADLMSLRVCSGISCTDSAIVKALYKAFYNGKVIPDVVNISLGSHENYSKDVYSYLMQDLSAKFGTVFFISASNSGPGFRSLNHFGNSGSVVMVGANVSNKTLRDQYNLPDSTEAAKENLLFFSSLGPSYTGEMKPNIIAPGAAISAVEAAGGYMSQANGTSMSSPLAAGAFASILAKSIQDGTDYSVIKEMRAYHLANSTSAEKTLLPYVYAMRDALQNGATYLSDLSAAQQGYGLLNAGKTKLLLDNYVSEINEGNRDYFEIVINDYKKGYDRTIKAKDINTYKLSLGLDGERTKESLAGIISKGLDVELNKVEVLSANGGVQILKGANALKYFSIVDQGNDTNRLHRTHVALNNRRTTSFYSKRHKENMIDGKTYLAHYIVKSNNVIVSNILDIVHHVIEFDEAKVSVAAIDPSIKKVANGFAKSDVAIKTNVFHRYPFYVDGSVNALDVKLAIAPESEGRLYLQLYNPDGKEVEFKVAESSSITGDNNISFSTSTIEKAKVKKGIWELTVASSSSTWLSASKYDLLVEGSLFGAKVNHLKVKKGEEKILPVQLGGKSLTKIIKKSIKQFMVEKVETKSSYFSIHPLNLPVGYTGKMKLEVDDKNHMWWGSFVPHLLVKKGDEFVKYDGASGDVEGNYNITKGSEDLYFAMDTITNYSDSKLTEAREVSVEVIFDTSEKVDINIENEIVSAMDIALLKITSPKTKSKAQYKVELSLYAGDVEEYTDLEGNTVLELGTNAIENQVKLSITN